MVTPLHEKRRSALEAFGHCPFHWHEVYVRGVSQQSPEARRGSAVHAAIKHYVSSLFEARASQDLDLAREAFRTGLAECPTPPQLFDDVHHLFWTFCERFELDVDAYLLHELRPEDPDEYKLQIDLAYARGDVLEMWDWKTHYRVLTQRQAEREFQPRFYLARARRIWPGFQTYRFVFVFLRFGAEVVVEFDHAALDRVDEQTLAIERGQEEALARQEFPAIPGDHCGFCALECPIAQDASRAPVRILTPEDRDRIAGEYLSLVQAVSARRAALESYCTVEGDIDFHGVRFGFTPVEKRRYPAAGVVDVLRASDVEPAFTIGRTPIGSYLKAKKWAHVRDRLEGLARVTKDTRFEVRRGTVPNDASDEGGDEVSVGKDA